MDHPFLAHLLTNHLSLRTGQRHGQRIAQQRKAVFKMHTHSDYSGSAVVAYDSQPGS